jgi:SagB-type dehydrogenase family enzyme
MCKKIYVYFFLFLLFIVGDSVAMNIVKTRSINVMVGMPVNTVIKQRRSVRNFAANKELMQDQIIQLLWAAQGITAQNNKFRAVPSAGALYPLELYVVKKEGVWHYEPSTNNIRLIVSGSLQKELAHAALNQKAVRDAAVVFVITGIYSRTTRKYGERGTSYVYMEAGAAMENMLLEAVNLGLGAVPIGAFHDQQVQQLLQLPKNQKPLLLISVGYKAY